MVGHIRAQRPERAPDHRPEADLLAPGDEGGGDGIDLKRRKRDISNPEFVRILEQDRANAKAPKMLRTPTFFINGMVLADHGFDHLRTRVKQDIAAQYR